MLASGLIGCGRGDSRPLEIDGAGETSVPDGVETEDVAPDTTGVLEDGSSKSDLEAADSAPSEPDVAAIPEVDVQETVADTVGADADRMSCRGLTSDLIPLPEASGAALLDAAGTRILLVADSGNVGRALVMDLVKGESKGIVLPLGVGAGDDVEGLERAPDGRIFGLTSSGFLRAWSPASDTDELSLVLGPVAVSDDPEWVCDPFGVNCAANFEGLCLHPVPALARPTGCAGWAASKAHGELVCLRAEGSGYRLDPATRVSVTPAEQLSACAYEPVAPYRLIAGGNLYAYSALWEVAFDAAGAATVRELIERGAANQEAVLLLPGGGMQSFGDAQELLGDESPRITFECR